DANGYVTGAPGKTLQYNAKSELSSFAGPGGVSASYLYDHEGFRVSKIVHDGDGGTTSPFLARRAAGMHAGHAAMCATLGGERCGTLRQRQIDLDHTDYAGNTQFVTDPAGVKIASIAYRRFGNITRSNGVVDSRTYGYHPFDAETGFFYMRRRYYSPELGRFLT